MNELWFYIFLLLLTVFAMVIALYPLRKHKGLQLILLPLMLIFCGYGYWHWGAWSAWQNYLQQQDKQRQVQAVLQTLHGPQDLIEKLKAKLNDNPESARGWYLLGKLYASQQDWNNAMQAFSKAHHFVPDDELITINYLQSQWQLNEHHFDEVSRSLITAVLAKNPNQPDALAMLAMDAFMSHDYQLAIDYWQRLLLLAPKDSDDANEIRQAIAKAHKLLKQK